MQNYANIFEHAAILLLWYIIQEPKQETLKYPAVGFPQKFSNFFLAYMHMYIAV